MTTSGSSTPRDDGFAMPAEFSPHQATWMSWPAREDLWGGWLDEAKDEWAATARAVGAFEPVAMVCDPGQAEDVRNRCGSGVEPLEVPIDDSWLRDNGPIFVTNPSGEVALVHFGFNSWGGKYLPFDRDAALPEALAARFGVRRYVAPFVLEGGSFFVDGEGTVFTTEQCLLNPNRNPSMSREEIEEGLRSFLGVDTVDLASARTRRGPRHRRARRRARAVRSSRGGHAGDRGRIGRPQRGAVRGGPRRVDADADAPRSTAGGAGGAGQLVGRASGDRPDRDPVHEPLPGERRGDRAGRRVAGGRAGARAVGEGVPGPRGGGCAGRRISHGGGGPHCITQQVPAGSFVS